MKNSLYLKKISSLLGGLLLILTTLGANTAQATVFYVASNGDDSSTGSEVAPFRTISHGVSVLSAGDTLYVKEGTYKEYITNDPAFSKQTFIPNGTSWEKPVTVAANPGDTVTIIPGSGKAFFVITDGQDKYLIIDGFIIDGQKTALYGFKFGNGTQHVRVQNSEIKNSKYSGILVSQGLVTEYALPADTYHEFINLHVHHNGSSWRDHGYYISTSRNLVEHCHIHHNSDYGGKFYASMQNGGGGTANYNIFRYNTIHDNGQNTTIQSVGFLLSSGIGNQAYGNIAYNEEVGLGIGGDATDTLLYNNITYNNSLYGIKIFGSQGGSRKAMVYNNTVYGNPLYGIAVRDGAENTILKNNIAYNNGNGNIWLAPDQSPGTIRENNLLIDPKFEDPLQYNFKLKSGSPAIDSGVNIQEVKIDYFGVERYQGEAYDIGAIEQVQTDDLNPPATPAEFKILQ